MFRPHLKIENINGEIEKIFVDNDDKNTLMSWMKTLLEISRSNPEVIGIYSIKPVFEPVVETKTLTFRLNDFLATSNIGATIAKEVSSMDVECDDTVRIIVERG